MATSDSYPFSEGSPSTTQFSESSENCNSCSSLYSCCFHSCYWLNGMPRSERKVTVSEGKL